MRISRLLAALVAGSIVAVLAPFAQAQSWPAKTVRLVVVFPAGRLHRPGRAHSRRAAHHAARPAVHRREQGGRLGLHRRGGGGAVARGRLHLRRGLRHARGQPVDHPNISFDTKEGPRLGDAHRHLAHGDRGARGPALQGLQGPPRRRQGEAGERRLRLDRLGQPRASRHDAGRQPPQSRHDPRSIQGGWPPHDGRGGAARCRWPSAPSSSSTRT